MSKLIVANWKMNPGTVGEAVKLAKAEDKKNIVIVPPPVFIEAVKRTVRNAKVGAQNAAEEQSGPWTGEVSPAMLISLGVEYVILGHSERRMKLRETDAEIAKKISVALDAELKVILCVGEPIEVRKKGLAAAKRFVQKQLTDDLKEIISLREIIRKDRNRSSKIGNLLVAYEPVWAISTSGGGKETPEDAAEMARFIREFLDSGCKAPNSRVLYGGSVTGENAPRFLARKEFDGVLVGGASLKLKEFNLIVSSLSS